MLHEVEPVGCSVGWKDDDLALAGGLLSGGSTDGEMGSCGGGRSCTRRLRLRTFLCECGLPISWEWMR